MFGYSVSICLASVASSGEVSLFGAAWQLERDSVSIAT